MNHQRILVVFAALLATVATARGQERFIFGTRSLAMGGTGVASSTDAAAAYANPAAFSLEESWDFTLPLLTLNLDTEGDFTAAADRINDDFSATSLADIQAALDNGTVTPEMRQTALQAFLYDIPGLDRPGEGITVRASLGPAFRFKNWGFSAIALAYAGLDPMLDLTQGLSLSQGGFPSAISSTPNNCGGDTFCQSFSADLVTASSGQLTQAQAEQLVYDAGINTLSGDPRARDILTRIVS